MYFQEHFNAIRIESDCLRAWKKRVYNSIVYPNYGWMNLTYWSLKLMPAHKLNHLSIYSSSSSSTWNDSLLWLISGREGRFLSFFVDSVSLVDGGGFSNFFDLKTMRWLRSAGFSFSSVNQKHYQAILMRI